jgi:hypothetical protein
MRLALLFLFGVIAAATLIAQRRDDSVLDLTKPLEPRKERLRGTGGGLGSGESGLTRSSKTTPFRVTLLGLDKQTCKLGDQIIYEVSLENTSGASLLIPWSTDYDKIKPGDATPPGYVSAFLTLMITSDDIDEFVAGRAIYGSNLLPRSLKRIGVGQTLRIRAAGQCGFAEGDAFNTLIPTLPRAFQVRARYTLLDGAANSRYVPSVSSNELKLQLTRRD